MCSERPAENAIEYGETWVYEGIIGAIPGLDLGPRRALALQFIVFEAAILILAWYYGYWGAAIAGTVAVVVATIGSAELLRIAEYARSEDVPKPYQRLLFGSNVEVVLSVFAFIALLTHLFVLDPRHSTTPLLESLLGSEPPAPAVFLTLLVLWDVCYRIGAGWWASVASLWRTLRYPVDSETRRRLRRGDIETLGFAAVQLAFVPFLLSQPVLLVAVVGHVVAVTVVIGLSVAISARRE